MLLEDKVNEDNVDDWAMTAAKQFAASASGSGLKVPVQAVAEVFRQIQTVDIDLSGVERVYSSEETACFFDKSPQWLYWGLNLREEGGGGLFYRQVRDPQTGEPVIDQQTGEPLRVPIEPRYIGKRKIRRFTLQIIKDMAVSLYQNATIKTPELHDILGRIQLARLGKWVPEPKKKSQSEFVKVKGKWVKRNEFDQDSAQSPII